MQKRLLIALPYMMAVGAGCATKIECYGLTVFFGLLAIIFAIDNTQGSDY
jgi:hypothetical protein